MYYHLIAVYTLLALVIGALIYLYIDEFTEKTRRSLFLESSEAMAIDASTTFETFYKYDVRYDNIKGKVKVFIKFLKADKNNIITIRVADINDKAISKEITLADERTGKIEFTADGNENFFHFQSKTSSTIIELDRLELEY